MSTQRATVYDDLITWLDDHSVEYEVHEHPITFTATDTAHAEGVDARTFAKVVGIRSADGSELLAVLDAPDHVDLAELARFLGTPWVTLLTEHELTTLLPACEPGTVPPIPELVCVPVIADEAIHADDRISFHAGNHRTTVRVKRVDWERAAGIRYGVFANRTGAAA